MEKKKLGLTHCRPVLLLENAQFTPQSAWFVYLFIDGKVGIK